MDTIEVEPLSGPAVRVERRPHLPVRVLQVRQLLLPAGLHPSHDAKGLGRVPELPQEEGLGDVGEPVAADLRAVT